MKRKEFYKREIEVELRVRFQKQKEDKVNMLKQKVVYQTLLKLLKEIGVAFE